MKNLIYEETRKTPKINFDYDSGIFEISGRSIPENSYEFYKPVMDWLDAYCETTKKQTIVKVFLEYLNTSSSKYIFDLFKKFETIHKSDKEHTILIEWFYDQDDDDMIELGDDYRDMIRGVPFEMHINKR